MEGLEITKEFEGWKSELYNDQAGFCTMGYGHLIAIPRYAPTMVAEMTAIVSNFNGQLCLKQGESLLLRDTSIARRDVLRLINVELDDDESGALTSFVFKWLVA